MKTKAPIRIVLSSLIIILFSSLSSAQDVTHVLNIPEGWQEERIDFPLSFAPSINYQGFEELRFAPGWKDSTSQEFWTYCFIWHIKEGVDFDEKELTLSFKKYYDGLMGVDDPKRDPPLDPTKCTFKKTDSGFEGEMTVYDNFFRHTYMKLYVDVNVEECIHHDITIVRCNVSKQAPDHEVWDIFEQVKLQVECE